MYRVLAVLTGVASVAFGAGVAPCYSIVPGDRLLVPSNVPAFIGPASYGYSKTTLTLQQSDGGVRPLEQFDGGGRQGYYALFVPGTLVKGEQIVLESNQNTCTASAPTRSEVTVLEAAPFPTELGDLSFGEPVGFLSYPRSYSATPDNVMPSVKRDVQLVLPDAVFPWLSVMRITINGSDSVFGHLARSVTSGAPTVVGTVVTECQRSHDKLTKDVEVVLEIPGRAEVLRTQTSIEMDCAKAPPPPGCSAAPGLSLGLFALLLARRRRQGVRGNACH